MDSFQVPITVWNVHLLTCLIMNSVIVWVFLWPNKVKVKSQIFQISRNFLSHRQLLFFMCLFRGSPNTVLPPQPTPLGGSRCLVRLSFSFFNLHTTQYSTGGIVSHWISTVQQQNTMYEPADTVMSACCFTCTCSQWYSQTRLRPNPVLQGKSLEAELQLKSSWGSVTELTLLFPESVSLFKEKKIPSLWILHSLFHHIPICASSLIQELLLALSGWTESDRLWQANCKTFLTNRAVCAQRQHVKSQLEASRLFTGSLFIRFHFHMQTCHSGQMNRLLWRDRCQKWT